MEKIQRPIDVVDRFCAVLACRKPIENWTMRKRFCDLHMPKPKDVDKHWRKKGHSGFVSLEVPSETIEKLDLMLEELGFKNRSAYIRYILERELLCWEEK